jgi:hypothetical protein
MIGGGALGQPAATAVRHVAAQNGVWSLGNFGGVPPKSAMMYHQPAMASGVSSDPNVQQQTGPSDGAGLPNKLEDPDYHMFSIPRLLEWLLRQWEVHLLTATNFFASSRSTQNRRFAR